MSRSFSGVVAALLLVVAGVVVVVQLGLVPGPNDYERTTVAVIDQDGSRLATVDVRVADTFDKRYTGLSNTESLDRGEGMLFVHDGEGTRAYVMREMAFPIDIVFIDANGTITTVHHAPLPENTPGDELKRYEGYGKYVLEVPYGYTNETGIDEGDRVRIAGRWGESTRG